MSSIEKVAVATLFRRKATTAFLRIVIYLFIFGLSSRLFMDGSPTGFGIISPTGFGIIKVLIMGINYAKLLMIIDC